MNSLHMSNTYKKIIFIHCFRHLNRENLVLAELLSAIQGDIDVLISWEKTEFATLEKIYLWSLQNNGAVCSCHLKGIVNGFDNQCIIDWRQYMSYFILTKAQDCINEIQKGYDVCGVDYVNYPAPHFSGNFWWASAQYIRGLPYPSSNLVISGCPSKRHVAEFWITMQNHRVKCFRNINIHVYERHLHRYEKDKYYCK